MGRGVEADERRTREAMVRKRGAWGADTVVHVHLMRLQVQEERPLKTGRAEHKGETKRLLHQ